MDKSRYQSDGNKESVIIDPTVSFYERVVKQCDEEYWPAWWFERNRVSELQERLKLYSNQMRDKSRVGSMDIFSFHQTLLATLYDPEHNRMSAIFKGRQDDDDEIAENLTDLAERDYDLADIAEVDYGWDFNASLFGRSLLLADDYDFETETPVFENIDRLTWLRDPTAQSVNGDRFARNAMRFGGREIRRTTKEIFESGDYFNLEYLRKDTGGFRTFSPYWDTERARKLAQGYQIPLQSYNLSTNNEWTLLQWFTIINGERWKLEFGNDRTLLIRAERMKKKKWPIIDRTLFPIPHDWDGVSVFDIMEHTQRFRASLINTFGDAAKRMAYPMHLYDEDKIRKNVDKDPDFDKWVPVQGNPHEAYAPLQPSTAAQPIIQWTLDYLDKASQRALGLSEIQLGGAPLRKGTMGQFQLQQGKLDQRFVLSLNIWGWSERKRWERWYELYEENFKGGIERKMLTFEGPSGTEHKDLKRKDVIVNHPNGPIVHIETKALSEARKLREYQQFKDYLMTAVQFPETDKVYGIRKLGEKVLHKKQVKLLIPYTHDELEALEENEQLDKGKPVIVAVDQNHTVHLRINGEAKYNDASEAHLKMHRLALLTLRNNPQIASPANTGVQQRPDQSQGKEIDSSKGGKGQKMANSPVEGMGPVAPRA